MTEETQENQTMIMKDKVYKTIDTNEAVAGVVYATNEVIAIYPITPASPMGEWAEAWESEDRKNMWNTKPAVIEMQSEAGAAGAVHGALLNGSLTTTFTASQGLLLMLPNMYKIAGELTPCVIHVAARALAAQGLSIFGDQSDVMAVRATGFALLGAASPQEATDFALISQAATLEARVPFVHFFDGFRTSHEIQKIEMLDDSVIREMIDEQLVIEHRNRGLNPDSPQLKGSSQNPDVYFQGRESVNAYYNACPDIVQKYMDRFAKLTGRQYKLYEYHGAEDAEHVVVVMGSGYETTLETVEYLNERGAKLGVVNVHLYRPFDVEKFVSEFPATTKSIAVLDRTKEPGSVGEPLYTDTVSAIFEGLNKGWTKMKTAPKVVGGRYGLSSKDFTPAMAKAVFENLAKEEPKNHFTIGVNDDLTHTSLDYDHELDIELDDVYRAVFYGLGSDGTVGANKNTIKIIGENTDNQTQGYFVYDSKKAGSVTISHLRFGPRAIRSPYLINHAHFLACHQPMFVERYDMLKHVMENGTFLLNTHHSAEEVWDQTPKKLQEEIIAKKLKFYVIDAYKEAHDAGMGKRINTIMQVCFFSLSGVLPPEQAIEEIKNAIRKTYGRKGEEIVAKNLKAVDHALSGLKEVKIPQTAEGTVELPPTVSPDAPEFVRDVLATMIKGEGDELPVSALPFDGTYPTGTSRWDKANLAQEIPAWEPDICIQCAKCIMVCPHGVIRAKAYEPEILEGSVPDTFKSIDARDLTLKGMKYTIQIAPEDCTGCTICVDVCPAKSKEDKSIKAINMKPQQPLREKEISNWDFFLDIPELDRRKINIETIRQQQFQQPLFEFSSACAGCGETPYLKLLTQLFGDRALVANATGCSSIYGGNLPTTPWSQTNEGRGPAWANSLFEDNAEFGLGFRLSVDKKHEFASELLRKLEPEIGSDLVNEILSDPQRTEDDFYNQRERLTFLKQKLNQMDHTPDVRQLMSLVDIFVRRSIWIVGGDGWAYDIGFGGLDHVIASGENVNILVLDTEVYSNTGGQMSKSTPRGATAKFATGGKQQAKKDLGAIAMTYGNVYVAQVVMGAKDAHTLRAFLEAEAYDGPSIIIAYSPCIAHGIDLSNSLDSQKKIVDTGEWILYRYNPALIEEGKNPLVIDSKKPKIGAEEFLDMENRFKVLTKSKPEEAERLAKLVQQDIDRKWELYENLSMKKVVEVEEQK